MMKFGVNYFRSVHDGVRDRVDDLEWDEFATFMKNEGHRVAPTKDDVSLFSATKFKTLDAVLTEDRHGYREDPDGTQIVRRQQRNALQVELLILDYDGTLTLDEARERFKDYEYLGYTSYGHMKTPGTHKFRLIFPLSQPIPAHKTFNEYEMVVEHGAYYDLSEALIEFAPGCDPVITKTVQAYYLPSAPSARIADAVIWRNHGVVLDWTTWRKNDAHYSSSDASPVPRKANGQPNRTLDPDQEFTHPRGTIKASDVTRRIQHVRCPFHGDATGSEFLVRYDSGVVCFQCKRCGPFTLSPAVRLPKAVIKDACPTDEVKTPGVEMEEVWLDHTDRDQIEQLLAEAKKDILSDKGVEYFGATRFKSHAIYLPEGAGKSQLALSFLSDSASPYRNHLVFACKSWKQVIEKEASFRPKLKEIGRTSQIAWSFDGSIERRFNVKVRRGNGKPFSPGDQLEEETIAEIIRRHPDLSERFIRMTWAILGGDSLRFEAMTARDRIYAEPASPTDDEDLIFDDLGDEPPAIIFTTFAQLRLVAAKRDRIPRNWIIWFDDPDLDELIDIKPRRADAKGDDKKVKTIEGTRYDVRPAKTSLGLPFISHRCIYTTTERVTLRLLEHHLKEHGDPCTVHGERRRVTGGQITILGTDKVQKKFDAIVPLLVRRLEMEHAKKVTLIADGIPAEFNHSTNKGRNDLKDRHLLVEVSLPHPAQIKVVCDALGLPFAQHRHQIGAELMLDKMHQAIGRNSGFRTAGFECVVLADKNRHASLVENCGYAIDGENSVIVDKTEKMSRRDSRLAESASPLVKQIGAFLNNPFDYLSDLRKIKPDITFVLDRIADETKRFEYIARLLAALTSLTRVRFDLDVSFASTSHLERQVLELGLWVLTQIPDERLGEVQTNYREILKISEISEVER